MAPEAPNTADDLLYIVRNAMVRAQQPEHTHAALTTLATVFREVAGRDALYNVDDCVAFAEPDGASVALAIDATRTTFINGEQTAVDGEMVSLIVAFDVQDLVDVVSKLVGAGLHAGYIAGGLATEEQEDA